MSAETQAAINASPRLSRLEAAWVIARRDFIAVLFSRAFLFFLVGPLFPVLVGGLAGSIGGQVSREAVTLEVGIAMSAQDNAAMIAASERIGPQLRGAIPVLREVTEAKDDPTFDARTFMEERRGNYAVIITKHQTSSALRAKSTVGPALSGSWQQTRWPQAPSLSRARPKPPSPPARRRNALHGCAPHKRHRWSCSF